MEKVNERGETLEQFLENYDDSMYRHPSNTVDMILMTVDEGKLKMLLIKRKDHPFIGDWAMPGGFVNFDEDLDEAVLRELSEETSITENSYFRQLYTFGNTDRDPRTRVITTVYLSLTPSSNIRKTKADDDAALAGWFTVNKNVTVMEKMKRVSVLTLENEEYGVTISYEITDTAKENYIETRSKLLSEECLAADHIKAVNMAVDQVQHRAVSTGIMFNLLPKESTLREMQTVYEALIGKTVDTGNFRRDVRKMLKETGHTKKVNGKSVKLYAFDPMYSCLRENL